MNSHSNFCLDHTIFLRYYIISIQKKFLQLTPYFFSGKMNLFSTKKPSFVISAPYDVELVCKVEYDPQTNEFKNVPKEYQKAFPLHWVGNKSKNKNLTCSTSKLAVPQSSKKNSHDRSKYSEDSRSLTKSAPQTLLAPEWEKILKNVTYRSQDPFVVNEIEHSSSESTDRQTQSNDDSEMKMDLMMKLKTTNPKQELQNLVKIASGMSSTVYTAVYHNQKVAVKHIEITRNQTKYIANEIKMLGMLNSNYFVNMIAAHLHKSSMWIMMEYMDGGKSQKELRRRRNRIVSQGVRRRESRRGV